MDCKIFLRLFFLHVTLVKIEGTRTILSVFTRANKAVVSRHVRVTQEYAYIRDAVAFLAGIRENRRNNIYIFIAAARATHGRLWILLWRIVCGAFSYRWLPMTRYSFIREEQCFAITAELRLYLCTYNVQESICREHFIKIYNFTAIEKQMQPQIYFIFIFYIYYSCDISFTF